MYSITRNLPGLLHGFSDRCGPSAGGLLPSGHSFYNPAVKKAAKEPAALRFPLPAAVLVGLLALFQAFLGLSFIRSASPTYDEAVHLASGYSYLASGRYRLNIKDHPPLAEMWSAVALLPTRPFLFTSHPDWIRARVYHYSDRFLYRNKAPADRMMNRGRTFSFLTLFPLLGAAVLLWAFRLGGPPAVVGSAAAFAFCPVLVSNLALVTTDGLSAVLFFLVFWTLSPRERSLRRWAAAGALAGLALASKFNMIVLGPLAGGLLVLEHGLRSKPRPPFPWTGIGVAAACALAALAAAYRFHQLPLYWEGLFATIERLGQGRASFFMGDRAVTGFWLYFPVALLIKTPLATLGLAAAGAVCLARSSGGARAEEGGEKKTRREEKKARRGERGNDARSWRVPREALWVIVPLAGYFTAALTAKVQIGIRHLLPMMPFLALLAGLAAARLWGRGTRGKAAAVVLGLWVIGSVLRAHPHQLAYFNAIAGGPGGGYKWLTDSNVDWGQGLKGLASELKGMGNPPVYLSYFGCADPKYYGIKHLPLPTYTNVRRKVEPVDPAASGRVLVAVSATNLQGTYFRDRTVFAWLKDREPLKVVGHSIFLYDLTEDPEGRRTLAALIKAVGLPVGVLQ